MTTALAFTSLAGGVVLSGGEVMAQTVCLTNLPPNPPNPPTVPVVTEPCINGDWTVSGQEYKNVPPLSLLPPDTFKVDLTDLSLSPDEATVDIDFDNPGGTIGGTDGFYNYFIETADHNITKVMLDALDESFTADFDVWKYIYKADKTTFIEVLNVTELSGPVFSTAIFSEPKLWIHDRWSSYGPGNGNINAIVNVYVPGPLPVLGAGAAFGFSRKLRSRIKASSAA
jgi:hypothetical protein